MNRAPAPRMPGLFAQIAARLVALSVAYALISAAIVVLVYLDNVDELADVMLTQRAKEIAASVSLAARPDGSIELPAALRAAYGPGTGNAFRISNGKGVVLADFSRAFFPGPPSVPASLVARTDRENRSSGYRIAGVRLAEIGGEQVAIELSIRAAGLAPFVPVLLDELVDHVAIPLIPLTGLLLIFNVLVVRHMLKPLKQAATEAERLDPARRGMRLAEPAGPSEVVSLIRAVNLALERMEESTERLREFSANAAHELKTPLAIMTLAVERLPPNGERDKLQRDVSAMTRLVHQMLDMARADSLTIASGTQVDLGAVAAEIVSRLLPLAISGDRQIEFQDAGGGSVTGHADAIGRALRNVVENALTHAPSGSRVLVRVGPGTSILVQDSGPGIAEPLREEVFKRFWRGDHADNARAGLGLSITDSIVRAHGGRITLDDAPGGGAALRLDFPPAA